MGYEQRKVHIDAPSEVVWRELADFGATYRYNPSVVTSYTTSDVRSGLGATRHCDLTFSGASVQEQIVGWDEGSSMEIRVLGGTRTPPFKEVVATLSVSPHGTGSRVDMTFDYSMKYGPIGALMDRLIVKRQYAKALTLILAGLKHYIETGEEVGGDVRVDVAPVAA